MHGTCHPPPERVQAAQEQGKRLEADLAAALDASAAADGASAGVLRAEVAMLQARNARVTQDAQCARGKADEAQRQVSRTSPDLPAWPLSRWLPRQAWPAPRWEVGSDA